MVIQKEAAQPSLLGSHTERSSQFTALEIQELIAQLFKTILMSHRITTVNKKKQTSQQPIKSQPRYPPNSRFIV